MPSESRDRLTILRAQAGDRQALDQALRLLQQPLFRYLRYLAGDPNLAEDILQEVMVIVYRKIRRLRDPDLFLPWAYRIATREAFHRKRRERRWQDQVRDDDLLEAALLLAFVFLADFNNRLHLLLVIATVGIYTILALGLVALGAHVSRNTQLILRALDARLP